MTLRNVCSQLVAHIHDGAPIPDTLKALYDWLADDGRDELTAAFVDGYAIKLSEIADDDVADQTPLVLCFPLQDGNERSAILGLTVEVRGQAGAVPVWHGAFRTRDAFYESLRERGCYLITSGRILP
jgi:hypothetical protein